ncbi:PHP domain-containing protein [Vallitalea pronyensis]|uniref:PHP domain-containing protein n=1 Tax=Vallitalea pronyensis TaxID=1348613 RepID=A0A8J8SFI7_9FIRM|nr:PHP domain-containing protein [Vallitalea pronyensis]QUI21374.1 PHP domain-containing protein [Vallitalea pronyensis]
MNIMDLHTHTQFSDGDGTVEDIVRVAKEKGIKVGISDHVFCSKMNDMDAIENYLNALDQYDVYKGVEANMKDIIHWPDRLLHQLDYVISSVHTFYDRHTKDRIWLSSYFGYRVGHSSSYKKQYKTEDCEYIMEALLQTIEKCFRQSRVDIYGHCTILPFYDELQGTTFIDGWENEILHLCEKYQVALELSGLWKAPSTHLIKKALNKNIQFSLGSDCHRLTEICNLDYPLTLIQKLNIPQHRMFTIKNNKQS